MPWVIICVINGHQWDPGSLCDRAVLCHTAGLLWHKHSVLCSSAASPQAWVRFPLPMLPDHKVREPNEAVLDVTFSWGGSKSLPCGETDRVDRFLFRGNMSSLHTQSPSKLQEAESSSVLSLQQVSTAQYLSFLLLVLSLWDQQM